MQTRDTFAGLPVHTRAGRVLVALAIYEMTYGLDTAYGAGRPTGEQRDGFVILENIAFTHLAQR